MKRKFPLIVFILVSFAGQIHAQNIWQKLTLPEAKIVSVQASPNGKLFLMTKTSIYSSTNLGNSWEKTATPKWQIIDSQAVLYSQHDSIFSFSSDEGKTWNDSKIPPFGEVNTREFLATNTWIYLFPGGPRLYRTKDRGSHWEKIPITYNGYDLTWEAVYASPKGSAFGSFSFDGSLQIFRDTLFTFAQVPSLCFVLDNDPISGMSFDYDGFAYGGKDCALVRSSDDGLHWVAIDSFPLTNRYSVPYIGIPNRGIIAVNDTETVLSIDHADTWQKIGLGIQNSVATYYHSSFTDRNGNAFIYNDTSLYRLSIYASVHSPPSIQEDLTVYFNQESSKIELQSSSDFGETTASLYTIHGRLLRREKINIPTPGSYEFDASGIHSQFGFLVLQTAKGVIARKIILSEP